MNSFAKVSALALCIAVSASAHAFDFATTRGLGLGGAVVLSQSSATSRLEVAQAGPVVAGWRLESGIIRRYEISELDQAYIAAAFGRGGYSIAVGLAQTGDRDFYSERMIKGSVAYRVRAFSVGLFLSAMKIDFGGAYEGIHSAAFGLGATYRWNRLYAALTADNVNSPTFTDLSSARKPAYSLAVELKGSKSHSLVGRLLVQPDYDASFGIGQRIVASDRGALFWGLSSEPLTFGGGADITIGKTAFVTYAASFHSALGLSHNLSVSWRFGRTLEPDEADFE